MKCTSGIQFDKILFHLHKLKFYFSLLFYFNNKTSGNHSLEVPKHLMSNSTAQLNSSIFFRLGKLVFPFLYFQKQNLRRKKSEVVKKHLATLLSSERHYVNHDFFYFDFIIRNIFHATIIETFILSSFIFRNCFKKNCYFDPP